MDIDVFSCWDRSRFKDETLMPPGFRFHPTDEELITHYLLNKVLDTNFTCEAISQVNLNKSEPWDLPEKAKKMGDKEWFFFTQRDRKYPTGLRTNRATEAGYWKATGKDREIKSTKTKSLLGMKKTLVFYKGRAPKGVKSCWVMHEYRLDGKFSYSYITSSAKDEWVLCKVCLKSAAVSVVAGEVSSSALSSGSVTAPTSDEHVSCFSNASVSAYTKSGSFSTYLPSPPPPRQFGRFDDDVAFGQFMELGSYVQFSFDAALLPNLPPTVFPPPPPPQSFSTYGGSALGYWPFAI